MAPVATSPVTAPRGRIASIDVMRGLIMVVMALDHTRDFWSNADFDPADPATSTPAYFATRWITHLCAPWFMVLAGAGAWLSLGRGRDRGALSRFLLTRGLWLIVLEFTLVKLAWEGPWVDFEHVRLLVLWALGCSMIVLAGLVHLPMRAIVAFGLTLVLGHNLLDAINPQDLGAWSWLWKVLHVQSSFGAPAGKGFGVQVLYPLVPWIGVMALGYAFGALVDQPALRDDPGRRARLFAVAGVALLATFAVVRSINRYGNLVPWTHQATTARTVMSFFAVTKYPPSLDFLLATVGIGLLLLAAIERARGPVAAALGVLRTYGRVPLLFYVLHVYLLAGAANVAYRIAVGAWPSDDGPAWGVDLPVVYAVWAAAVIALYPVCRWFASVKERRRDRWLGYL